VRREFGEGEVYILATLQGKTALMTGASRGIGRAAASALADAGAQVLVHYGRSAQDAESLVAAIRSKGDTRMRSGRIWELQKEQHFLPSRVPLDKSEGVVKRHLFSAKSGFLPKLKANNQQLTTNLSEWWRTEALKVHMSGFGVNQDLCLSSWYFLCRHAG
jgi:NAD(P)-dependent dehydrogenase (short-subunit alcohol dehydrogenase family)